MLRRLLLALGLSLGLCMARPVHAQGSLENQSLLAREPQTPEETFEAALTMLKLARPELARQYLAALLESQPADDVLLALRDKHGTATFVQLSRLETLQPESIQLLDLLNTAARNRLADPAFQTSLVQGLSGSPRERESSLDVLRALGDEAPSLLIGRLAAGAAPEEEVPLMEALLRLPTAAAPLRAALTAPNERLQTIAADLLGRLADPEAALPLSVVAFDPQSPRPLAETARRALARIQFGDPAKAAQVSNLRLADKLRHAAQQHFSQSADLETDDNGQVSLWSWNATANTVQLAQVSPTSASLHFGEQASRAALQLTQSDTAAQTLLLGHLMWRDVQTAGWEQPVPTGAGTAHDLALTLGPELTSSVLKLALEHENPAAALVALKVLALTGSRRTLLASHSPVIAALQAPEPRVQFAAAETVLQLDPQHPFPGGARVVEILARSLLATPQPKSVVVDPNAVRGAAIAALVSGMGFDSGLATTGQRGFEIAASEGNVELAVLHLNTVQWELTQTIANLRADPRTKRIPIAVYGPPGLRTATYRKLKPYSLVGYVDDAGDSAQLRNQLTPLIGTRRIPELTESQRAEEIASAAGWLRHIADGQRTNVFPLDAAEVALADAAGQAAVAQDALVALGAIGKPSAQTRMAEVGFSTGYSVETRLAAITQLAFHIQRYGRMLDNALVQQVADAYQQAESPELQTAWASVVGALRPDEVSASQKLLAFPPASAPLP